MERIENRTFGELEPRDTASLVRTLTYKAGLSVTPLGGVQRSD